MRKAVLLCIGLLVLCIMPVVPKGATASSASTESVQRTVLAELFTGTWCMYCPGGEGAMDRLAKEYPRTQLAVIEWHNEDDYVTVDDSGKEREDFYNISAFPTAYFDGVEIRQGGSEDPDDNSTYDEYKDRIETRLSESSPIIIRTSGYISGDRAVVDATITAVGSISQSNLSAHFVLYNDENETVSAGGREYRLRYTALKSLNSSISLSEGDPITLHKEFSLDPAWTKEKLGVVTFVQTNNKERHLQGYPPGVYYTAEVLQADDLKFITDTDVSLTFQAYSGSVAAGGEFVFNGVIKNTGSISESYEFSIQNSLSAWSASYGICKDTSCIPAPYTIDLVPDEEVNVEVTVCSPSSAQAGESAVITFTVYSETNAHIKSATTLTVDAVPAPTKTSLNTSSVSKNAVVLSWTQNTDTNFDRYEIHKSTTSGFTPSNDTRVAIITTQSTISYEITNLAENTRYYFKLRVYNTDGLYTDSDEISAKTALAEAPLFGPVVNNNFIIVVICVVILVCVIGVGYLKRRKAKAGRVVSAEKPIPPVAAVPKPEKPSKADVAAMRRAAELEQRLNEFTKLRTDLFVDDIRAELSKVNFDRAEQLLVERKRDYERYLELGRSLKDIEEETTMLSRRLAKGDLTSDAYERARDDLERKKKDIDEELWKIQRKIFREKYEKPF